MQMWHASSAQHSPPNLSIADSRETPMTGPSLIWFLQKKINKSCYKKKEKRETFSLPSSPSRKKETKMIHTIPSWQVVSNSTQPNSASW